MGTVVAISLITTDRTQRQRRELKNIPSLAASIAEVGLINPIVVTEEYELIAGERRLAACQSLGWDMVPITIFENLSPAEQTLIELEENVKRDELPWRDHCAAIATYHRLLSQANSEWTQSQSAEALGLSRQHMSARMAVQAAIERNDPLVCEADKYSVARGIVERQQQRAGAQAEEKIADLVQEVVPGGSSQPPQALPEEGGEVLGNFASLLGFTLIHTDFHEWAESTPDRGYNFIHCDFPYGINADSHDQGGASALGGYADSPEVYWELLNTLSSAMETGIVAPNAHLMFWFSMTLYVETLAALRDMGWEVNPTPLIWHKGNVGIIPRPAHDPRQVYETALIGTLGGRNIVKPVANLFSFTPPSAKDKIHMSEKSPEMLSHFFRMFVDGTTKMLDPTCGSANAVRVAYDAGAAEACGLERDEEFYLAACEAHDGVMGKE